MARPLFLVPVADLERGPCSVNWAIPEAWLASTLSETEAKVLGDGTLDVELTKTGREVIVRGRAQVSVTVPCVVTLDPLPFDLKSEIFLLLVPASPAEKARPRAGGKKSLARRSASPEPTASHSLAEKRLNKRPRRAVGPETDLELSEQTAARDTYDGEKIVLDEFVREFVLLEVPPYPRRSDLPSDQRPAIGPPSPAAEAMPAPVDPRLLPLARIKSRLTELKKE